MPSLFQLDVIIHEQLLVVSGSSALNEGRWNQIKNLIKVDPSME
jgi:hypothetical protein